jgi:hypothetical protein
LSEKIESFFIPLHRQCAKIELKYCRGGLKKIMANRLNALPLLAAMTTMLLAAAIAGCGDSPTDPHVTNPTLNVLCLPAGALVRCTATFLGSSGSRDVTSEATWLASDPALGSFQQPGLFVPSQRGEVGLWARYAQAESLVTSVFLVDPPRPTQRLYFLSGIVADDASGAPLAGATVEILDGYAGGARSVTNEFGHYQIDRVLTGETLRVTASKPGYSPSTLTYRVDSPVGPSGGNPPFLDFRLRPTPGTGA